MRNGRSSVPRDPGPSHREFANCLPKLDFPGYPCLGDNGAAGAIFQSQY
jgi:hypothetical protein